MVHCSKKGSRQYNKTRNTVARYWLAIWFTAQTGWSLHGSDRSMALPFLLWEGICQDVLVHILTQALDRNSFIWDVLGFGMSRCQPHLSYTKGELRDISPTCPSWNLAPSLDFSNFGRSSIFFCAASCLSRLFSCSWKMKTYNKLKLESYHDVGLDQITQDHGSWWDNALRPLSPSSSRPRRCPGQYCFPWPRPTGPARLPRCWLSSSAETWQMIRDGLLIFVQQRVWFFAPMDASILYSEGNNGFLVVIKL